MPPRRPRGGSERDIPETNTGLRFAPANRARTMRSLSQRAPLVVFNFNWGGHIPAAHVRYVAAACRAASRPVVSLSACGAEVRRQVLALAPEAESKLQTPPCPGLGAAPARNSSLRFISRLPRGFQLWQWIRTNPGLRARHALRRWQTCGAWLRRHLADTPGLVFFPYLDDMVEPRLPPADVARAMPAPWAGVFMDSSDLRAQTRRGRVLATMPLFASPGCRGMAVFDAAVLPELQQRLPRTPVRWIPDTVDYALPREPPAILQTFKRRANGRPIVGLFGHLSEAKNIDRFLELAGRPENRDIFFAVAGQYEPLGVSGPVRRMLAAAAGAMENVLALPGRLPSEADFNALIAGSDAVFAVYRDFSRSSSLLSKAGFFNRPLLVADEYFMGECVRTYGLGACVPPNRPEGWSFVLRQLLANPPGEAGFIRFQRDFSEERFDATLGGLLNEALRD